MNWEDLESPKNCFTVKDTTMFDIPTKRVVRHFSQNTKIVVTQKCTMDGHTFYRTNAAKIRNLDWAFEAGALGLPDEVAPPVHSVSPKVGLRLTPRIFRSAAKQKHSQKDSLVEGGATRSPRTIFKWLFKRHR